MFEFNCMANCTAIKRTIANFLFLKKKLYIYIYISFSNYKNFIVNEYFNLKLICNVYIIVQTTSPIRGHKSLDELEYIKSA